VSHPRLPVSLLSRHAECDSTREIEEQTGVDHQTAHDWVGGRKTNEFANRTPPASRQHFDVWNFPKSDESLSQNPHLRQMRRPLRL
jgi:hypothetical protein